MSCVDKENHCFLRKLVLIVLGNIYNWDKMFLFCDFCGADRSSGSYVLYKVLLPLDLRYIVTD